MPKEYLGDGAFADLVDGAIVLTAEDGVSITDRIVLEPEVYTALTRYVERLGTTDTRQHPEDCLCDTCAGTPGTHAHELIHGKRGEPR